MIVAVSKARLVFVLFKGKDLCYPVFVTICQNVFPPKFQRKLVCFNGTSFILNFARFNGTSFCYKIETF